MLNAGAVVDALALAATAVTTSASCGAVPAAVETAAGT
jgi:hypothetical protein